MNDDRSTTDPAQTASDADETTHENVLDKYDDAVIAADATGMLAGERLITVAEIEEGLQKGDTGGAGDV